MRKHSPTELGFTLIELIIVFSIMTVLASAGVASFVTYSRSQGLDTAMKEFKSTLYTARSRATSQLRDSSCFTNGFNGQGYELEGYQVVVCCSFGPLCSSQTCSTPTNNYELQAVYGYPDGTGRAVQTCLGKKFTDSNVHVDSSVSKTTGTYFFFSAVTGSVTTNATTQHWQVGITGYGLNTKLATVSATGVIQ